MTTQRPDLVMMSDQRRKVLLVEVTVPWEDNLEHAHGRKLAKYEELRIICEECGWQCKILPVEVGTRGFIARSTVKFLSGIGLTSSSRRQTMQAAQSAAESASAWIWQLSKSGTGK